MRKQRADYLVERGRVQAVAGFQPHRLIEMLRLTQALLEEPVLYRRKRNRAFDGPLLGVGHRGGPCREGEVGDGLVLEQVFEFQMYARLARPRDDLDAQDRV